MWDNARVNVEKVAMKDQSIKVVVQECSKHPWLLSVVYASQGNIER